MRLTIACVAALLIGFNEGAATRQNDCESPLAEGDLRQLIGAGVPPIRLRQFIVSCGIDFGQADISALEARVRQIGAPATVVAALFPPDGAAGGATWVSPMDQRRMILLSRGHFQMGSPLTEAGRDADEGAHEAAIEAGFWMDVTEVTNAAFRRFVLSRPEWQKGAVRPDVADANYLKSWDGNNVPPGAENQPVVSISWHAARAYAAWAGKRLPSEAEWEYAARAGTATAYWWGDAFDERRLRSSSDPIDDGEKRRTNAWGITDVTGGVWEWTASLFRPYPFAADGRDDARAAGRRAIRGGASTSGAVFLRLANRNSADPASTSETVGFRCVQ